MNPTNLQLYAELMRYLNLCLKAADLEQKYLFLSYADDLENRINWDHLPELCYEQWRVLHDQVTETFEDIEDIVHYVHAKNTITVNNVDSEQLVYKSLAQLKKCMECANPKAGRSYYRNAIEIIKLGTGFDWDDVEDELHTLWLSSRHDAALHIDSL